jgi:hypothetical protein
MVHSAPLPALLSGKVPKRHNAPDQVVAQDFSGGSLLDPLFHSEFHVVLGPGDPEDSAH